MILSVIVDKLFVVVENDILQILDIRCEDVIMQKSEPSLPQQPFFMISFNQLTCYHLKKQKHY